jgi:hypothetical protein
LRNYAIFISAALILVPFVYATSLVPDACAAIRDPKFDTGTCETNGDKQTCCWYQKSYPGQFGRGDKYCQTCTYYHDSNGEPYEKCTEPKKQTIQLAPGAKIPQDLPELQLMDNNTNTDENTFNSNVDNGLKSRTDANNDNDTLGFNIPNKLQSNDAPILGK